MQARTRSHRPSHHNNSKLENTKPGHQNGHHGPKNGPGGKNREPGATIIIGAAGTNAERKTRNRGSAQSYPQAEEQRSKNAPTEAEKAPCGKLKARKNQKKP